MFCTMIAYGLLIKANVSDCQFDLEAKGQGPTTLKGLGSRRGEIGPVIKMDYF